MSTSSFHIIPLLYDIDLRCASFEIFLAPNVPCTTDGFDVDGLFEQLPGMRKHRCDSPKSRSFYDEARQTDIVHLLEHIAVELLVLAGLKRSDVWGETGIPRSDARGDGSQSQSCLVQDNSLPQGYRLRLYGTDSLPQAEGALNQAVDILARFNNSFQET